VKDDVLVIVEHHRRAAGLLAAALACHRLQAHIIQLPKDHLATFIFRPTSCWLEMELDRSMSAS